ncbi:MAG: preprotein translocase subunit SecE [Candidatus Marinimicrobia bacterium]|nr:preprotein translocase subunit SecE [Candidatus Neomarinimicrobiota bacterium]MCH8304153.1 preprotein translocase subunit SecE [Candidatus Neomarinimicrobiota bacterium]TFB11541.1 preprotein translocase subunit SecE [Candidatus Marinimicrobia bacterium MT.SAG.2]
MITKIRLFFESVVFELKKVSWPSWAELKGSTIVVLVFSLILAIFLFGIDRTLGGVVGFLLQ